MVDNGCKMIILSFLMPSTSSPFVERISYGKKVGFPIANVIGKPKGFLSYPK